MGLTEVVITDYTLNPARLKSSTCLVIGGGVGVWDEFKQAKIDTPNAHVMAVNAVGCYVPKPLHYWFSLHCYRLKQWDILRRICDKETPDTPILFSLKHTSRDGVEQGDINAIWQFGDPTISKSAKHGGSLEDSGFFAMCIALVMGYGRVHLVGCPADDSGHVFIPEWKYLEHDKEKIKEAWVATMGQFPEILERVRSYSGLTKQLLGEP